MPGKFKLTLDGQTREIQDTPANVERIEQLKAQGVEFTLEPLPDTTEPAVPSTKPQPTAAAPKAPEVSAWETFKRSAMPVLRGAGETALDGYRMLTHGVTLGYDDDIADGVVKLAQKLGYNSSGQNAAQANAAAMQRSPNVGAAMKTIGNAATGIGAGMLAAPVAAAAGLTPAATGILQSGTLGALQSGGEAESNKLDAAGRGATFGLGAGVVGAGVGALASKLGQRLTQAAVKQRGQVLAPTMKVTQELQDRYGAEMADEELGRMLERHVPPNVIVGRSAAEYRDKLAAQLSKTGKQLQDTVASAGARGANASVPAAQEKLIQQIGERADEVGGQVGQINANTEAQLRRYLKQLTSPDGARLDFTQDQVALRPKTTPQDIAGFWKQRQNFDADARYSPTGNAPDTAAAKAAEIAAGENRDLLKGLVKQHAPELAQDFADGNANYGDIAMLKDIASRASASEANTQPLGSMLRNTAVGAALGGLTGWVTDSNPLKAAATGAVLLGGTGTMSQAGKALNSPQGRDMVANIARTSARPLNAAASTLQSPAAAAIGGSVAASQAFTEEDRLRQAVRSGADLGGLTAQLRAAVDNDDAFNRLAAEALKDPAVRASVRGDKQ